MRTITQAAEELNVSRKKIYNELSKLKIETTKEGKNNYISDKDYMLLKERVTERKTERTQNTKTRMENILNRDRSMLIGNLSDREYVDLKERITFLEEQIKVKDKQLQDKDYQINGLIQTTFNLSKGLPAGNDETAATTQVIHEDPKPSWIQKLFRKKA